MSTPDRPVFVDSSISFQRWEETLKRTEEERARIDKAHELEGVEIFFAQVDLLSNIEKPLYIYHEVTESFPGFVKKVIGPATKLHYGRGGIRAPFELVFTQPKEETVWGSKAKVARVLFGVGEHKFVFEIDKYLDIFPTIIRTDVAEERKLERERGTSRVLHHIWFSHLEMIRTANWLANYYKEQTGQAQVEQRQTPVETSPLDAS